MSVWTPAIVYAAVKDQSLKRLQPLSCSTLTQELLLEHHKHFLLRQAMNHDLAADLLEVKETLKSRQLMSSTVPFWSFQSTGPLLVTGKALQTAEEVSILSLVVLMDISSTFITARSKYFPDSWTTMESLTTSIVQAISTRYVEDATYYGTIGIRRHTIPLRRFISLIVQDQLQPTS